jgi:polar amino acid transport system substrate-binding protein
VTQAADAAATNKEALMLKRNILAAVACVAMFAAVPARAQTAPQSSIDIMEQRGTMTVGMSTFVPWAMRDQQGKLVGFEVDVATKLAQDLGLKLELVPTAWDGIIPALIAGKFDVIIGGMTITTKRNLTVNFSAPYDYAGTSLAVAVALQNGFKLDMLNSPSMTIACRRGTTACTNAAEYFPKATLRQFDDDAAMTQEVLNGNANAFAASEPLPSRTAIENPGKLFTPLSQDQQMNRLPSGMALRKGDVDTLNVLNNWIVANTKFLQARRHYWFETQDWRAAIGKVN